ncbi:MAG: ogr/Delta-like zinc finger family protein [Asticcacaulis sp.]
MPSPDAKAEPGTRGASHLCPVCRSKAFVRKSETISHTLKAIYLHCTNTDCGHTWLSHVAYVRTISPSALGQVTHRPPAKPANDL